MDKEKMNLVIVGMCNRTDKATMDGCRLHEMIIAEKLKREVMIVGNPYPEPSFIEQILKDDQTPWVIINETDHEKVWKRASQSLIEFGLAAANLSKELSCFNYVMSNFGTPWAPLFGIQAHFFRFDPKKYHTACARIAPMIGHKLISFHRKCWMHAKTFMNVKFIEELEVVA